MIARDRFREIFGGLSSLADELPWTENIANIYEHVAWYSADVLGISKTRYWKQMVTWADEPQMRALPLDQRLLALGKRLQAEIKKATGEGRYAPPLDKVASPYEALRRTRYFLESYLNHEFDILMSLVSDDYVSGLYATIFGETWSGSWVAHGNGGRFQNATFAAMQMDNICYNASSGVLVANELKLSGAKNSDQILKYALLFEKLVAIGFVPQDTQFHLLFVAGADHCPDWAYEIDGELTAISRSTKPSARALGENSVVSRARAMPKAILTWSQLARFNAGWVDAVGRRSQVERKLILGFNASLREKAGLQGLLDT